MNNEIYKSIIKNSKIAYMTINCKTDNYNKYRSIEILEQSKEVEKILKLLIEKNVINREEIQLIINNWIKKEFEENQFDKFMKDIIKTGHKKIDNIIDYRNKKLTVDIYYLEDHFMIVYSLCNNEVIKIEEEKNKLKLDFFANLSHELRTPINLISSTTQLIKLNLRKLSPIEANKFYKYIDIMEVNSLRLVRLINNVLDSTRIDAGFINFNPVNADIVSFIEEICDSTVQFTEFNDMNLVFDTDKEEEIVLFDPNIIERTMLNLLSNAVKFNKKNGNIYVNLLIREDKIIVKVKDEGVGIPREKLNSIFKRFEQVQSNGKIEKQGSGIGLYLVKSLITLHGGNIYVKSKVNEGSEFIVEIPKEALENSEKVDLNNDEARYNRLNIEFSNI